MENINRQLALSQNQHRALATITKEAFLGDYAVPAVQVRCRTVNSYPAVFACDMPALIEVEKAYGYEFLQAYLEGWIVNLREFVNVGKKMTDMQTFETAMIILQDYKYLTIADINLLFKRAKSGYYGKLYDRLDGQIILDWFRLYDKERTAAAVEDSINEASKYNADCYERTSEQTLVKTHEFKKWQMKHFANNKK